MMPTAYCPYTLNRVADAVKAKQYAWAEREYELNIVGVRSSDLQSNAFNDWLTVSHKRASGVWAFYAFQATTDPGLFWRQNPDNVHGVAVVVPGQYKGLWRRGLHQNKYPALVQAALVSVYRDNNKDAALDLDPAKIESGIFGINCHHARDVGASSQVDKWSAGCQVVADADDFAMLLTLAGRQESALGIKTYTYTLLTEQDVR